MRTFVLFTVLLAMFLAGAGTAAAEVNPNPERLNGIARVFMHQPNEFSFLVVDSSGAGRLASYYVRGAKVQFMFDVPEGKANIWMESDYSYSSWGGLHCTWMKIHLRMPEDLNGAGWTRKTGKATYYGTTAVIQ